MFQQSVGLSGAQGAGQIDDGVPAHRIAQAVQQLQSQRPGPRAKLPDLIGARGGQRLLHLHRQGLTKQGRQARRGDEITARGRHGAKLLQGVGVVTQARLVQGHGHETVKTDPAARLGDGLVDQRGQFGGRRGIGRGHVWIVAEGVQGFVLLGRVHPSACPIIGAVDTPPESHPFP